VKINFDSPSNLKLIVWTILILSCLVFLTSIYTREVTLDDAYFAEQSYWFEKKGYVKSELFSGVLNWEERSFVYHKLHVWQGALLIKFAGWNPYFFKSLPILYLLVFVFLARFYFDNFITKDRTVFLFFLFLLFIHTFTSQYGFEFRPEIMIMSVGFASFLGIVVGLAGKNILFIFLAGILAGVAALFHLNGLIFIIAGMGLLLFNKAYRPLVVFGIASLLAISLYFLELIPGDNFSQYIYQFKNDPAITQGEVNDWGWIFKFLTAPKRFFNHLYLATFTILFLFSLIINWKEVAKNNELKQTLVYLFLLELTLSVISPGGKVMYLTYHIPYMLIVISSLFYSTLSRNRYRRTFIFLLFLYVVTQLGHTYSISSKKNTTLPEVHADIMEKYQINKSHRILAPVNFIFNEIQNTTIQGLASVKMVSGEHAFSKLENLLDFAYINHKDYVIIGEEMLVKIGADKLKPGIVYNNYQLVGVQEKLYVFRNIAN
jgi:hypothetical protein